MVLGLMARNPKQKALYEVIKSSQKKTGGRGVWPETSIGKNTDSAGPTPTMAETETKIEVRGIQGMGRQLAANLGRKRVLLVPYRVAAILTLVFILAVLAAFRLGRLSEEQTAATGNFKFTGSEETASTGPVLEETSEPVESETATAKIQEQSPLVSGGDNVIVVATYRNRNDLEPVQEYFARNGVETEIWLRNNYFYLVTKQRFESTERRGTDGYLVKQKIKKIGADYKAPSGYESFRPNLFQDAYGMKVE